MATSAIAISDRYAELYTSAFQNRSTPAGSQASNVLRRGTVVLSVESA